MDNKPQEPIHSRVELNREKHNKKKKGSNYYWDSFSFVFRTWNLCRFRLFKSKKCF